MCARVITFLDIFTHTLIKTNCKRKYFFSEWRADLKTTFEYMYMFFPTFFALMYVILYKLIISIIMCNTYNCYKWCDLSKIYCIYWQNLLKHDLYFNLDMQSHLINLCRIWFEIIIGILKYFLRALFGRSSNSDWFYAYLLVYVLFYQTDICLS